jgi:2-polyprenyl-6-methoxyphenol hydroxylase-like FAD-dependent oxidoreductase
VPFPDGSYKLVASVTEAPHQPAVSYLQDLVDARGPQAQPVTVHEVTWGSRFRIHHGVADRFAAGRVALAGDAAHDNSPLGGQGMNAGIGDAAALAAALDAAIERRSAEPLQARSLGSRSRPSSASWASPRSARTAAIPRLLKSSAVTWTSPCWAIVGAIPAGPGA